jgi:hypothetical protein
MLDYWTKIVRLGSKFEDMFPLNNMVEFILGVV